MAMSSMLIRTFQLSTLATAVALAGCGGGGNDTIAPPVSSSTGSSTKSAVNISPMELLDVNGKATRTVSAAGATAKVRITDAKGKGVSGALVTFTGEGVTFGTTNGSVLTNADGVATISVKPTSATDSGSYTLSATATYDGNTATTPAYNFSLQAANTTISAMTAATTSLASGGSTNITLSTMDATTNTTQNDIAVNFTATCGTFTNTSVTSSNQGNVTNTYKAIDANGNLCEGNQTITATTANGVSQSIQVTVAGINASSIVYTSTTEVKLGAKGSGSSSSGQIEFTVYANGTPAANQNVIISKTQAPSDFSFVSLGNQATQTLKSDSSGKVIVQLYPGALPGPVEIKATLANDANVYALSKNVSVATGRASQNGLSISLSKNMLALGADGDTSTLTARMVDRLGNAVPDGTVISFVAEGGAITPSCATSAGQCLVTFTTQNPRPVDGRVSILAYVEGDKSYTDVNGDNQYTAGVDTLTHNIGDLFRDDNENGLFDAGEFIYKRGATGNTCAPSSFDQPNIPGTCDTNLIATLRYETVLGLAESTPTFNVLPNTLSASTSEYTFRMYGNSAMTLPMASGTTISINANDTTNYSPVATIVAGTTENTLSVSKAQPNTTVVVTIDSVSYSVVTDSTGSGTLKIPTTVTGTATVSDANTSCKAEFTSGYLTVPALNAISGGTVADDNVRYKFKLTDCKPKDEVKVTVTTPAPDAGTHTYTVTLN